ncbi:DUF3160 domain-containing protein [Reichenbachiella versicolor]|uniref:DUF3160 domain-containing protein n=1 Tax=Reichenbachiella versicolor TaxID=1821036 RepID=UPI0013A5358A|nr:DUF3160 domain-containing protein [Reichenbachiella versicolor]
MNLFSPRLYVASLCTVLILASCGGSKKEKPEAAEPVATKAETEKVEEKLPETEPEEIPQGPTVIVSESKEYLQAFYKLPHIEEYYEYMEDLPYLPPRDLNVPEDLSSLSYADLRLLRNEVFARNGYLFNDPFLRGYFNRFKWYRPIFDVDTFKIVMNRQEQELVKRILNEEKLRKDSISTVNREGLDFYNYEMVVNEKQFQKLPTELKNDLVQNNFSILDANRKMPFYVYDRNAYEFIPHYITTDLYLYILHKYFSRFLEKLEQNYMRDKLDDLLYDIRQELPNYQRLELEETIGWVDTYCQIGSSLLFGAASSDTEIIATEFERAMEAKGKPLFIKNMDVDYAELKPRSHYTKSEELKSYFKAFKWMSLNGVKLENGFEFRAMVALAFVIKSNEKIYANYKNYVDIVEKLAGQEVNLSIRDIITAIEDIDHIEDALDINTLDNIQKQLSELNKERIKKNIGPKFRTPDRMAERVYFLSSTYSVSGEIFSKFVHIDGNDSKRPFPRGLDVPAVFRDTTAEKILLSEYKDGEYWEEYEPKLKELQEQFDEFNGWEVSYAMKGLKTALSAMNQKDMYPDFMKSDAYNRKELSTMLSSWAHIKHDLVLYQEKPYAAEAGQGGGPGPPKHYSYVEPNLEFWNESLSLVKWLEKLLYFENSFESELTNIKEIGFDLKKATEMQLAGKRLSDELNQDLFRIGARIEYTLLGLLETDHLPEREKSMALITDVYIYNGTNLNVAVGHADDIYVVVPINGEYQIARGSVFSYYEFKGEIYNDEEWRRTASVKETPERPEWIAPLIRAVRSPEGQMEYRYSEELSYY